MVLHQQGAGISGAHAGQRGHLGGGCHLRTADIHHHSAACSHLTARRRVGADHRAGCHRGIHSLRYQHRDTQLLELLLCIGLHIVGQVRHGNVLGAKAHSQGHILALAHRAAGHRRLLIDIARRIVTVVLLLPGNADLAGDHLLGGSSLVLRHADIIAQRDIGLVVHQVGGIVQDHPAQRKARQCKCNGNAEQCRQEDGALFLARCGLFAVGRRLFGLTVCTVLVHGTFHHLFGSIFCNILVLEHHGGVVHVGVQRIQHFAGGCVAVLRQLCHGLFGDLHQCIRHLRRDLVQRLRLIGDLLDGNFHHVVCIKGQMTAEHLVHHHAHRVDIAGAVGLIALGLLRADIVHAAHGLAAQQLVLGTGDARNAKIHHAQLAVVQKHDVLGLDVPVHHTVGVGMFQRL